MLLLLKIINYISIVCREYQKCHNYHTVGIVVLYVVYYALVVVNYVVGGVLTSAPLFTTRLPQLPRGEGIPIPRGVVILAWYFITTPW